MKTEIAFDMIRDLGKAFRTACIERGYDPQGGWDGDLMSGLAGFVGTYLIGPREGLFKRDEKLSYIYDEGR